MINTIQPREYFPIARILPDPADVATYYVRAVIRNAKTNATIETVNLTDQTGRIFSYNWQAVADSSGQGLFITITTSVYTDSGYTTKSDIYGEEQDTFMIYDRMKTAQAMANQIAALISPASSPDIDYKKIKKMIDEAVAPIKQEVAGVKTLVSSFETQEQKETDLLPVLTAIANIPKAEPQEKIDFSPVFQAISAAREDIKAIEIPEQKETDISPILDKLDAMDASGAIEDIKTLTNATQEARVKINETLPDVENMLSEILAKLKEVLLYKIAADSYGKVKPETGPKANSFGNIISRS